MLKQIALSLTLALSLLAVPCLAQDIKISGTPEKLNLVWQARFTAPEDDFSQLPPIEGVNIVSPCWFAITNSAGNISDKARVTYADNLHSKGYKVWALITNSFNPDLTHDLLQNKAGRAHAIEQMLFYADKYKLDGYNLDFENIAGWDRDLLTDFTKEITNALHAKDLTVSMDITIPSGELYWSECYDRLALGKTLDYVMLMTYDQHHPNGHRSGPNASLGWVEKNLVKTLEFIPKDKLLLGLPLYMRSWQHKYNRSYAIGKTLSMAGAEKLLKEKKITHVWQEKDGQYYFTYQGNDNTTYKIWQENKTSLALKADLVNKYALAGIASWRKGFETPDVWPELNMVLSGLNSPIYIGN